MKMVHVWCAAVVAVAALMQGVAAQPAGQRAEEAADMVVVNGRLTTLDEGLPEATALAVRDGLIVRVGERSAVEAMIGEETVVVDAGGRRVIPGLVDSHCHATRAGRFFNLELRWDGVGSLERGLAMVRAQAERTPEGQWVRVIGGWSPFQFRERRMPTIAELNQASPERPVFVLFLYSQGFLNAAGVRALGLTGESPAPPGSRYEFVDGGAILHAEPNPGLLYGTIGRLPGLPADQQHNSARHFYREMNRFGLTSAIDAGGGGHIFPEDYGSSRRLAESGELPVRVSYYLFPQKRGAELGEFRDWAAANKIYQQFHRALRHGYEFEGAGEFLVWSAGDFENFMSARPELDDREDWERQLFDVTSFLVEQQWPLRIHATYGESIGKILDVFERVEARQGRFAPRWAIDHAETAREEDLLRIRAMGGGIAIQNRMSFAGEYFVERYGEEAARRAPPVRRMLELGIPVGAGTDATRVSSYNPWLSLHWLVSGKTLGGATLFEEANRLTREEALSLWTHRAAWFSQEEGVKGRLAAGQMADFAILSADYMRVPEEDIPSIEAVLTVVGGRAVYAAGEFAGTVRVPELPAVEPQWSPVAVFGGYQQSERENDAR